MKALLPYVHAIEEHVGIWPRSWERWASWCDVCLDGGPSRALREAAPLAHRKALGAFFTGPELGWRAALAVGPPTDHNTVYFDPTCGAGDLLLAAARQLPVARTVAETLSLWGGRLTGCDLSPVFIRATRARLALLAMRRCGAHEPLAPEMLSDLLPGVTVGDALRCRDRYAAADKIMMNPPFRAIGVPPSCEWSTGRINSAALFTETAIFNSRDGIRIAAILPDVLRAGSRYRRWRRMVAGNAIVNDIMTHGAFDSHADIDVFLLRLTVSKGRNVPTNDEWTNKDNLCGSNTVAGHFAVRVGAVVPHRHSEAGPEYPYIHARSLPPWQTVVKIAETRRFAGTVFAPPFVAVRRTSGPRDRSRATASIVLGRRAVAVENHVVVCLPVDGSIERCQGLLARLQCGKTDAWLNRRIRCRHLTTSAVAEIPWWDEP